MMSSDHVIFFFFAGGSQLVTFVNDPPQLFDLFLQQSTLDDIVESCDENENAVYLCF